MEHHTPRAALISGSPSPQSKSRALLGLARERLAAAGYETAVIELATLPAEALLGRKRDGAVEEGLVAVGRADIVVASSPVYRATYSGLLKVFFDLLPRNGLEGKVGVPILTGASPDHRLALDHGLRPLFASLGAVVISNGVYGTDAQFRHGPDAALLDRVDRAMDEAIALLGAASPAADPWNPASSFPA
jgi:FMN reductase